MAAIELNGEAFNGLEECDSYDNVLKKFTFFRYLVLGGIMLYRIVITISKAKTDDEDVKKIAADALAAVKNEQRERLQALKDKTAACYRQGDEVRIWSTSKEAWCPGHVVRCVEGAVTSAEDAIMMVTVKYTDPGGDSKANSEFKVKTIPSDHEHLRPFSQDPLASADGRKSHFKCSSCGILVSDGQFCYACGAECVAVAPGAQKATAQDIQQAFEERQRAFQELAEAKRTNDKTSEQVLAAFEEVKKRLNIAWQLGLPEHSQGDEWIMEAHGKNPKMTKKMILNNYKWEKEGSPLGFIMAVFWGGLIFIQNEGVGFVIYFAMSALMDNFAIFFVDNTGFCKYVIAVALYSMALISFLPNCVLAVKFQEKWYSEGYWFKLGYGKTKFVVLMVVVTAVSFVLRLMIVYKLGWIELVQSLEQNRMRVLVAAVVPPIVDAVQATLLIASGLKKAEARELTDSKGNDLSYKLLPA